MKKIKPRFTYEVNLLCATCDAILTSEPYSSAFTARAQVIAMARIRFWKNTQHGIIDHLPDPIICENCQNKKS